VFDCIAAINSRCSLSFAGLGSKVNEARKSKESMTRDTLLQRRTLLLGTLAGSTGLVANGQAAVARAAVKQEPDTERGVRKGRLQQSSVHWCYGGPLEELAKLSAELGLSGIDVVHPKDWSVLKKYGLVSAMTPCMERGYGIGNGLNKKENHEGHLELVKERIDASAEAGFRNVLVFSGNRESGLSDEDGLANCAEALKQIAPYAESKGQVLCMELLNSKRDHKGYMCDRTHWGAELVQRVGSSGFKLLYDIYHMQIQEGDVIATIREFSDSIGHYHTAGVPGRGNLNAKQELNYTAIMEAIAEAGFDGYVGQEFIPQGDKVAALTEAVELCDV
jgi:hydroxypyruvate isomerase